MRSSSANAWILGVCALTAVAWWPVLDAGWFWDDRGTFLTNPWLLGADFWRESLRPHLGHWQPLTWWSLRLDHSLWTETLHIPAPRAHLLGNVLLHVASAGALTRLLWDVLALRAATTATWARGVAAATGALAWALHPCRVESVAWATERRDVLATVLLLAGLISWLRWRVGLTPSAAHPSAAPSGDKTPRRHRRALYGAVILFTLSALAKAWVVALPGALFGLEIGLFGLRDAKAALRRSVAWLLLSGPIAVVAAWAQHSAGATSGGGLGLVERVVGAGHNLLTYLGLTMLPLALAPLHPLIKADLLDARHLAGFGGCVALTGLLIYRARRANGTEKAMGAMGALGAWVGFVAWLAPVLGLAQSGVQATAERYLIVAHVPLLIFAVQPLARWLSQRRVMLIAVSAFVILGWTTRMLAWQQVWIAGPEALWSAAIAVEPRSAHAHLNRAALRLKRGAAVGDDLTVALALAPHNATAWKLQAEVLRKRGDSQGALTALRRAATLAPGDQGVQCNLGAALAAGGAHAAARRILDRAVDIKGGAVGSGAECRLNRAVLRVQTGDRQGAARDVQAALRQLPLKHPLRQRAQGMARALQP